MRSRTWTTRPLRECGQLLSGGTPNKADADHWSGVVPWFSSKELKSFDLNDTELHVSDHAASAGTTLVPAGTILFVVRGMSLANEFRVGVTARPATFNQDVKALVPAPDVNGRYVARCLRWMEPRILGSTESSTHGTKRLPSGAFEHLPIPLPPLPEQIRIAEILDKADDIRRKRKEAIVLAHAVPRSAFLELFGDPATNPKGWPVKPFDDLVAETQLGLVRAAAEQGDARAYRYVRMNAIRSDGHLDLSNLTRVDATEAEVESSRLQDGDFLFNTRNSRELVGKAAVYHDIGMHLFNNNILRVRFRSGIESDFVSAYWQTSAAQRHLDARKAGTTSVFAIYYKSLATLPVPVPPASLQAKYADLCAASRKSLQTHGEHAREADRFFDSLVSRAFQGTLSQAAAAC